MSDADSASAARRTSSCQASFMPAPSRCEAVLRQRPRQDSCCCFPYSPATTRRCKAGCGSCPLSLLLIAVRGDRQAALDQDAQRVCDIRDVVLLAAPPVDQHSLRPIEPRLENPFLLLRHLAPPFVERMFS